MCCAICAKSHPINDETFSETQFTHKIPGMIERVYRTIHPGQSIMIAHRFRHTRTDTPDCYMTRLLAALILLLTFASPVQAQNEGGVSGMNLKLCDLSGAIISTCTTNADGSWSLTVPTSGEYAISVSQSDFDLALNEITKRDSDSAVDPVFSKVHSIEDARKAVMFSWSMKDDPTVSCDIAARNTETGMPEGKRRYAAVQFIKHFDTSAPIVRCNTARTISGNVSYTVIAR
jgi:hypothetical protein